MATDDLATSGCRDRRQLGAELTLTSPQRRRLYVGLVAVFCLLGAGLFVVVTSGPGAVSEPRPVDRTDRADTQLTLTWTGPGCETVNSRRTELVESQDTVQVNLFVDVPPGCEMEDDVEHTTSIGLAAAVAGRNLIDGACMFPDYVDDPRCPGQD